ncbi:MAG: sodium:alanine symporter family protein [Candidatus Margulisbacteria bacterium]|nr:sodium:alanine symporter family protein [Candidatus Margulisiibacteriota bacterium]
MAHYLETLVGLVWNYPVVILCLATSVFFTLRLRFVQWRHIPHTLALITKKYNDPSQPGETTHFQALTTALSGTVGLGSITGVAIAIGIGGPGSIFWMWVVGFLGMATKYAEVTLSSHYKEINAETGEVRGGPMYYISKGLGPNWKWMSVLYSILIGIGAFGAGNIFQTNQAVRALHNSFGVPTLALAILMASLVGFVIIGGLKRISKVATRIVPFMCITYLASALIICLLNITHLPLVISTIFTDAFSGNAVAGGLIGSMVIAGVRRAVFSSESGLGSASIAHATAKTAHPVRQGLVSTIEPFVNTILICTATAIVIVLSGNYGSEIYQKVNNQEIRFSPDNAEIATLDLGNKWQVTTENIPLSTEKLRRFRTGKYALEYENTGRKNTMITLPELSLVSTQNAQKLHDGVRFSYFRESGDMQVNVLDSRGLALVTLELGEDGEITQIDPNTELPTHIINISGKLVTGKWQSIVLKFPEELKERMSTEKRAYDTVRLQFVPKGKNVHWYLDRIQTVDQVEGMELTVRSFDKFFLGFGSVFITLSVFLFAFTTVITWYYYGETAMFYLFKKHSILPYKALFIGAVFLGSLLSLTTVLNIADLFVGLMVIPNTIALFMLSGKIAELTKDYFRNLKDEETFRH